MQQVQNTLSLPPGPIKADENWLRRFIQLFSKQYERMASEINGHIGFGDVLSSENMDGVWVEFLTSTDVDTDFVVTHNLGRVPVGYLIMTKNKACIVYNGSVAWTNTEMTLRATVADTMVRAFIV